MLHTHTHTSASLSIHVSSATELVTSQHFGKQDPFLQFSLDFNQKDSFLRTFTHKNAGENATWNQTFTISLNGEENLYVEVLDEENTVNEVIGFCAIPINQVVHAPGANVNGLFQIYDVKGEKAGMINLQLAALGFPNSQPPNFDGEPVLCQSFVHEEHCVRIKSVKKKATGVSVGGALLGGALAVGAGFLGKKLYDDHQEKEEAERVEQEEKQRLEQEESERRQQERDQFDQERAKFEQEKSDFERRSSTGYCKEHDSTDCGCARKNKNNCEKKESDNSCERKNKGKNYCEKHDSNDCGCSEHKKKNKGHCEKHDSEDCGCERKSHHRRRDSDCSDDGDAKKWNPVGTYAAGDRVKYHNNIYVCLQGHTSNPTWTPDAAHSLWQTE